MFLVLQSSASLRSPGEQIRTRITAQSMSAAESYRGVLHAFLTVVRQEGFRGLYKGIGTSAIVRPQPFCGGAATLTSPRCGIGNCSVHFAQLCIVRQASVLCHR